MMTSQTLLKVYLKMVVINDVGVVCLYGVLVSFLVDLRVYKLSGGVGIKSRWLVLGFKLGFLC